jgi:Kinesin motor domain
VGSTLMNATSSRAHTVITIEFKSIKIEEGKKTERYSVINLVDLAGSEKAGQTGATGDRLKEGCAIN